MSAEVMERGVKTARSSDEFLSTPNKRVRWEFITDVKEQLQVVGGYSTSIFALPRIIVEGILAGYSVQSIRTRYQDGASYTLNYWLAKPEFWEALSYRDIQVPLQEGLQNLSTLLQYRNIPDLGGLEMHSYLIYLYREIVPSMLLACMERVERGDFDEAAYDGFFRLGATDLIQLVTDTMSSAVSVGEQLHYSQPGTLYLEGAGHLSFRIDPTDARLWQVIEDGKISIETRVATTEDYKTAPTDFRTRWLEVVVHHLLVHGPSCSLKVLLPKGKMFRLKYHARNFAQPVVGFVASVRTGFFPIPIYDRTPRTPITDSDRDELTGHVEQNFFDIIAHLPPVEESVAWDVLQ